MTSSAGGLAAPAPSLARSPDRLVGTSAGATSLQRPWPEWRYSTVASLEPLADRFADPWLTTREREELETWRESRRRRVWICGRLLAKQMILRRLADAAANEIEILSRDEHNQSNRPRVYCAGRPLDWSLSIAHSERGVLVALGADPSMTVGVDLTRRAPFSAALARRWFTAAEQEWFAHSGSPDVGCFLWAAKEALYKACQRGEGFDPRQIEILRDGTCFYRGAALPRMRMRSWIVDGHVAVMAFVPNEINNPRELDSAPSEITL